MPANTKLSELEACVLGLVWAEGPCTAYAVRRIFQLSPSPHWSGSAGAIYPIVARLTTRRLIRSRPHATGRRRSRLYEITPRGLDGLRLWLGPPLPDWAAAIPADPLRTRLRFLGALPPRRRNAFLAEAEAGLREHLQVLKKDFQRRREDDRFSRLMARGAIRMVQARLAWIREIGRELEKPHRD
jgi:DNA-binding PadR family transcriptional regulator